MNKRPRYRLGREIEHSSSGRKWLIEEDGVHPQYSPILSIITPYDIDSLELAKASIEGWNQWHEAKEIKP